MSHSKFRQNSRPPRYIRRLYYRLNQRPTNKLELSHPSFSFREEPLIVFNTNESWDLPSLSDDYVDEESVKIEEMIQSSAIIFDNNIKIVVDCENREYQLQMEVLEKYRLEKRERKNDHNRDSLV